MDLVRDLLDKRVVDRNGRDMGRVDGFVLDVPVGEAPRVAAFELGPSVLAHRLSPRLGRLVRGLEVAFGIADGRPLRIPFRDILDIAQHVTVDRAFGDTSASSVERRVRSWLTSLPGGS
jgi:sporulation protein YlmC with PRC-barrel domain